MAWMMVRMEMAGILNCSSPPGSLMSMMLSMSKFVFVMVVVLVYKYQPCAKQNNRS
jgi:hypothetical protein